MKIANNIAALNAWKNLSLSNARLNSSVEKLSSGYRINRGADDPAGLLITETLRSQIGGLDQAIRNASDAVSMVQTAEGALNEISVMLNNVRSLAVHAANTGATDAGQIAADQKAVDKAIESIQRIAETTKFAGVNLLDGSAGTKIDIVDSAAVQSVMVGRAGASGAIDLNIIQMASQSAVIFDAASLAQTGTILSSHVGVSVWVENNGVASNTVGNYLALGGSMLGLVNQINADSANTKIWASTTGSDLGIYSCEYGDSIKLKTSFINLIVGAQNYSASDLGRDIVVKVGTDDLLGSGLVAYGEQGGAWEGTQVEFTPATNDAGGLVASAISITVGGLNFSLTQDADSASLITYNLISMQVGELGIVASLSNNGLTDIMAGAQFDLATDPEAAIQILDKAINDVATERAYLGAFQKYTLETSINNLTIAKENLTASESRIRDVDMAQEMMQFTKNQVLVQAGVSLLAQANQLPASVLQLLQG